MSTFKIDTVTGDLALEGNSFALLNTDGESAGEETAQRLRLKLFTVLGEWFLNPSVGIPYFENIVGVKPVRVPVIRSIFREAVLGDEQVASLQSPISVDYSSSTRVLALAFEAVLTTGEVLVFSDIILGGSL